MSVSSCAMYLRGLHVFCTGHLSWCWGPWDRVIQSLHQNFFGSHFNYLCPKHTDCSETNNLFYLLMLQLPQWAPRGWPWQSTQVQRGRRWALPVLSRQQRAPFGSKSATGCSQAPETFICYQWYPLGCWRASSIIIFSVIKFSFEVHKCCPALTHEDNISDSWEFPFPLFSLQ